MSQWIIIIIIIDLNIDNDDDDTCGKRKRDYIFFHLRRKDSTTQGEIYYFISIFLREKIK